VVGGRAGKLLSGTPYWNTNSAENHFPQTQPLAGFAVLESPLHFHISRTLKKLHTNGEGR